MKNGLLRNHLSGAVLMAVMLAVSGCSSIRGDAHLLPEKLIHRSIETLDRFRAEPGLARFAKYLPDARAVAIFPSVIKAGFGTAVEIGHGVLLAKRGDGTWTAPAFYTLGGGSFGFQAGIQQTEIVLIIRNDRALNAIVNHQGRIGVDAGLSVGVMGIGADAGLTADPRAYVLAFSNTKLGAYGGISIEGNVMARRKDMNEAFYGVGATPQGIVLEGNYSNPLADPLIKALGR